jgi:hypothetical protein
MNEIPKLMWINWFQGWDNAPRLLSSVRKSWSLLNPEWELVSLSNKNIRKYTDLYQDFPHLRNAYYSPQVVSDLLRLSLLSRYGGVWVDATLLATKPLNDWLPNVTNAGMFAFARSDRDRMLANWFIAAAPSNSVIEVWKQYCSEYWQNREVEELYFWHHMLFGLAYQNESSVRSSWDLTPKMSAVERTVLQSRLNEICTSEDRLRIEGERGPVEKLSHKISFSKNPDSVYFEIIRYWESRN